jgi:uncharacterized membrane protein YoaK (UPF0700 family)
MLATALAAVGGYVDALGFLMTGGFFVSFMSGNSTRLGVGAAQHTGAAAFALGLVALFVAGVVLGALTARSVGRSRAPVVLSLVTALLALAAGLAMAGQPGLALVPLVLAMGAENTIFAEEGEVKIGLTYMTGALVKLGKQLTSALLGGDRWAWVAYLLLWVGLVGGAAAGAAAYAALGLSALWIAALTTAALGVAAWRMGPIEPRSQP